MDELEEPRKSIVKFLEDNGWGVALAGNTMIVQNPNNPKELARWFVMEFIGGKKKSVGLEGVSKNPSRAEVGGLK